MAKEKLDRTLRIEKARAAVESAQREYNDASATYRNAADDLDRRCGELAELTAQFFVAHFDHVYEDVNVVYGVSSETPRNLRGGVTATVNKEGFVELIVDEGSRFTPDIGATTWFRRELGTFGLSVHATKQEAQAALEKMARSYYSAREDF